MPDSPHPRILLKLSGEVLSGPSGSGLDRETLDKTAAELVSAARDGARASIVLGGGNIFRGLSAAASGMDRVSADAMGMLATVINGLALRDAIWRAGGEAELFTAFAMGAIGVAYSRDRAREAMDAGVLAILAGGTGNPFFSTDSAAALRAAELGCAAFYKGTKVDGVYDADPAKVPSARRFETLTIDEMLDLRLKVIDLTAATLCRENGIDIRVFKMVGAPGAIREAALGEPLGTLVSATSR